MKNILKSFTVSGHHFAMLFALALLVSCGDDDPVAPTNEEELITTLNMVFTPTQGSAVVLKYYDEDGGDGPLSPVVTGGTLSSNTTYTVSLEILNESESPSEDVTLEIEEEGKDHQFFFEISNALNLTFEYKDKDVNNQPIGIDTEFTTGEASTGTLKVILRHEPNKSATGVSSGDITNAGGETDIETVPVFEVNIED